jgi:NRPS condensation-like uncharacterized protein
MKAQPFDVMQYFYSLVQPPMIRCCIRFDGKLEQRRLLIALERLLVTYPILKCTYQSNKRKWTEAGFCESDYLSMVSAESEDETLIREKLLSSLLIGVDPPIKFYWISRKETDTLCVVVSHLVCDGRGLEQLMYVFSKYYSADTINKQMVCDESSCRRRDFGQVTEQFSRRERRKILHAQALIPSGDTQRSIPLTGNNLNPSILTRTVSAEMFSKVHAFAKQNHASINDVFLTAYARALQEQFGWKDVTIPSPVDLRRFGEDTANESVCNLTGNYYCNIQIEPQERFLDTLQKISVQMSMQKAGNECLKGPMLFHLLYRFMPYAILKKLFFRISPVPVTSYTNLGNIDETRLYFKGIPIEDAFFATAIKPVPYFQLTVSTFRNQCTLSSCTYAGGKNLEVIQGLLDQIMVQLEETVVMTTIK